MLDFVIVGASFLLRWVVSLGPYSGKNTSPLFGDYEAQRHWMELTLHQPLSKWYFFDLEYWGLDYPPLTAYHMLLCGKIAHYLNPSWVADGSSRGFESFDHQVFMRLTVLAGDLLLLVPAALLLKKKIGKLAYLGLLFNPCLILVDHGHFQYNSISLSLAIIAACLVTEANLSKRLLGAIIFTTSLFYKQMQLYHALPFFFILLGQASKQKTLLGKLTEVGLYGTSVIVTSSVILSPFILFTNDPAAQLGQIAHRLFPFARGLFEDKVANVWCLLHTLFKVKNTIPAEAQLELAALLTLICATLPCLRLLWDQSAKAMANAMTGSALAFFLLSFQVHQKQCLLFVLPALLLADTNLNFVIILTHTAFFSLLPLSVKDSNIGYYAALRLMSYGVIVLLRTEMKRDFTRINKVIPGMLDGRNGGLAPIFGAYFILQEIMLYVTHTAKPPTKYPDMWQVIISSFCCGVFVILYLIQLIFSLKTEKVQRIDLMTEKVLAIRRKNKNLKKTE